MKTNHRTGEKFRAATSRMRKSANVIVAAMAGLLCLAGSVAVAEMRTFTSTDGREITAEILTGTDEKVTVKLESGREMTSLISVYSEADQKFIREWIKTQPVKVEYGFSVRYDKKLIDKSKSGTTSHDITTENWSYELAFENRTRMDLEDIELRYRIFVSCEHEEDKNKKGIYISDGILEVPSIKMGGRMDLRTKPVPLVTSDLKSGYVYTDGRRERRSEEMAGIWIKAFHRGERVWEYKSDHKAVRDSTFTDADALAMGKETKEK